MMPARFSEAPGAEMRPGADRREQMGPHRPSHAAITLQ